MATHQAVYVHTAQSGRHFIGPNLRDQKIIFFNKREHWHQPFIRLTQYGCQS
ncbi:hypothetical protein [Acinetobacter sp. ANC 4641]|uniref:hypothetical protein n=1 Tax=Acinetobacter sp. ANC 4641 TaxID=2529847 RepID=UPI0013F155F9|nr:hypothetical protein [Acinetobacter sp. ANC 4641]